MTSRFPLLQNLVDKLVKKTNLALVTGTNSWREQFRDAITVNPGETHYTLTPTYPVSPQHTNPNIPSLPQHTNPNIPSTNPNTLTPTYPLLTPTH